MARDKYHKYASIHQAGRRLNVDGSKLVTVPRQRVTVSGFGGGSTVLLARKKKGMERVSILVSADTRTPATLHHRPHHPLPPSTLPPLSLPYALPLSLPSHSHSRISSPPSPITTLHFHNGLTLTRADRMTTSSRAAVRRPAKHP